MSLEPTTKKNLKSEALPQRSILVWENEQNTSYPPHWHISIEIILPVENWYDVDVNGDFYHLVPGDILLIPSSMLHSCTAPETGKRYVYLFDLTVLTKLQGFSAVQSAIASPVQITREAFPTTYDDICQILAKIRTEYREENKFFELTITSLILNLLVKLGSNRHNRNAWFANTHSHKQREYLEKFNSVMEYIDSHYMEDLSLDEVAASIAFSKYHFSRLFKEYTNYTFCGYITNRRLKIAEDLLENMDLSIAEIALRSGFSSISTFNRVFKQQLGCTPSEYREKSHAS